MGEEIDNQIEPVSGDGDGRSRLPTLSVEEKRTLLTRLLRERAADSEFPLSYGQQALWFLNRLSPHAAHVEARAWRVRSSFDQDDVIATFQTLLDRHASLRTTYPIRDGEQVCRVHARQKLAVGFTDASSLTLAELHQRMLDDAYRPFDLERDPVMRLQVYQHNAQEHYGVLTVHHIAIDLWSMLTLTKEVQVLHGARLAGVNGEPLLAPQRGQYKDFVAWQRQMLAGPEGEKLWSYWRQQLSGQLPVLDLPTDRPRPAQPTLRGATYAFYLGAQLSLALREIAGRGRTTLYTVLLAAFQILLSRYTRQQDILVGSMSTGRTRPEFDGIVGLLANPIVLRANLAGNPTFLEFLAQVRATVLAALEHQDFPFSLLVERLQPERDFSRPPLCNVTFILQKPHRIEPQQAQREAARLHLPALDKRLTGLDAIVEPYPLESRIAHADLHLEICEEAGALQSWIQYNADLFDETTIARMASHFQTLLDGIAAHPEQCIGRLPLLPQAEWKKMFVAWNATHSEFPAETCIHELFEAQAVRTPEAIAVSCGGAHLSYQELNRRADQLADYLGSLNLAAEAVVGICLERSTDMIVSILGVLKAGAAYLPLDPSYPQGRLDFMLEDTGAPLLLTQESLIESFSAYRGPFVCLDDFWSRHSTRSPSAGKPAVRSNQLAYVIYTSGSTGKPKGVLVEHRSVSNLVRAQIEAFGITPHSRILQFAALSFDASVSEIFTALAAGATLVLADKDSLAPGRLAELLQDEAVSTVTLPPSLLALLPADNLPALQTVVSAGEACSADVINRWSKGRRFLNAYGPTESTVCATIAVAQESRPGPDGNVSSTNIGRPIANTAVYVLDEHGQSTPIGVPGELHIGGAGVARGYLNRPELTAAKFLPDPYSNRPGARMYKSGDLARWRPDGTLEFVGRIDDQVKIRGYRIEPGEIQTALMEHPDISDALVQLRQRSASGDRYLAAYLICRNRQPAVNELRSFLNPRLPSHMIPSAFVMLDNLPLTPSGKVDRGALPPPEVEGGLLAAGVYTAPRDGLELRLVQLWEEVLERNPIGVGDDFFDLGGHSLLAVRLLGRLEQIVGSKIPLAELFQATTIERLAAVLRGKNDSPADSTLIPLQPHGSKVPFFCVHPAGGSVFCYMELARRMGADQPFYGLQAQGLDHGRPPHTNLQEMAAHYLDAVRAVQPHGPYKLGGWSMGGLVAYEMARQLRGIEEVDVLALLDTLPPFSGASVAVTELDEATMLVSFALDLTLTTEGAATTVQRLAQLSPDERLTHVLEQVRQTNRVLPDMQLAEMRHWLDVFKANFQATLDYRAPQEAERPQVRQMVLYRPSESLPMSYTGAAWEKVEPHIRIVQTPGNHYTMLRSPNVRVIGEHLGAVLQFE